MLGVEHVLPPALLILQIVCKRRVYDIGESIDDDLISLTYDIISIEFDFRSKIWIYFLYEGQVNEMRSNSRQRAEKMMKYTKERKRASWG